jgi:histidine kinase
MNGYLSLQIIYKSDRITVSRAIRVHDGKKVILKSQNAEYPSLHELTRIKYEYDLYSRFSLDGLVPILSLEKTGNGYTLVMEDVGGIPLLEYWSTTNKTIQTFCELAIKITKNLSELHKNAIIHKDIKPANILVQKDMGKVFLIDLGLASLLQSEEQAPVQPESLEGTLSHISPEQTGRMNRVIDFRTDQYSLGITFYELLTGKLPFMGNDPIELVHAHIALSPIPPSILDTKIPTSLSDLVLKLLSKNAEDRYNSTDGLLEDLYLILDLLNKEKPLDFIPGERESKGIFLIPQKLYGREAEVSFLLHAFDQIASSRDRIPEEGEDEIYGGIKLVLVGGYSGVGKTALINEVHKPILEKRGLFLSGKFDQFKRNIPYYSLVQAFNGLVRQILIEREENIKNWRDSIQDACSPNVVLLNDLIPELVHITGKQQAVVELNPQEAEVRFQRTFLNFIRVFSSIDHPLTIFLDDLQWADLPTIKFIETLSKSKDIHHLLMIGAYRDNEINQFHPLNLMVQNLEKESISILKIFLAPLMEFFIERMICDTFHKEIGSELPSLVHKKTGGNPFFVRQFLQILYRDKCIRYTSNGEWEYDISTIHSFHYTENVVEMVASRLRTLSEKTQEILKVASCLGDRFELKTLARTLGKPMGDTALQLREALMDGTLLPLNQSYKTGEILQNSILQEKVLDGISYKFIHDRVQQAANSLLTEKEKISVHVIIGKNLYSSLDEIDLDDSLFEVTNHLNFALKDKDLIADYVLLSQLNYRAGKKASLSNASEPALGYFKIAKKIIENIESEKLDLELEFEINFELGISLYLNGKFESAERLFSEILFKTKEREKIFKVKNIRIILYINKGDYEQATKLGLETLKMFAIEIDSKPSGKTIIAEYLRLKKILSKKTKDELILMPNISEKEILNSIEILINIYSAAFFTEPTLSTIIILKVLELTLLYGNSPYSSFSFVNFATLSSNLGDYNLGYEYGMLSLKLNEQYGNPEMKGKLIQILTGFVLHWKIPLSKTISLHEEGFHLAKDSGDNLYSAYLGWFLSANQDAMGLPLSQIFEIAQKYMSYAKSINYIDPEITIQIIVQKAKYLMGETPDGTLEDHTFSEKEFLEKCSKSRMKVHLIFYNYTKARISFLMGKYQDAVNYLSEARKGDEFIIGMEFSAEIQFYQCISISSLVKSETIDWKDELFIKNTNNFKKWSDSCPENFSEKYYLILAEKNRIYGKIKESIYFYNMSIETAIKNNFIQNAGIASELTAKFFLEISVRDLAIFFINKSFYYFNIWGAKLKLRDIEIKYGNLIDTNKIESKQILTSSRNPSRITKISSIDLQTIQKTTQALSGEIKLEGLLEKLIFLATENAGANRALLFLYENENLMVEAEGIKNQIKIYENISEKDYSEIPKSVLQYSIRTLKPVILESAIEDERFGNNPYIEREKITSLLCMPIISKGKIVGLLYLENNLVRGAFTNDRIEILNMIISQAAISLENAKLYNSLEEKVKNRTKELQTQTIQLETTLSELRSTQAQLVEAERSAALGHLISGVAHEINNPLAAIRSNAEFLENDQDKFLEDLPLFFQNCSKEKLNIFINLRKESEKNQIYLSSRDERLRKKKISKLFENFIFINPLLKEEIVSLLTDLWLEEKYILLRDDFSEEEILQILKMISLFSTQKNSLKNIKLSTEKSARVIFLLRKYLKTEINPKHRETNLSELINKSLGIYNNYTNGIITIKIEVNSNIIINCLYDEILQIFNNLIFNSIQSMFVSKIKELNIKCEYTKRNAKDFIAISFEDSGTGIPNNVVHKLFTAFFTTKSQGEGIGLGLFISKIIAEEHGGYIEYLPVERGSKFLLALPIPFAPILT